MSNSNLFRAILKTTVHEDLNAILRSSRENSLNSNWSDKKKWYKQN